MFFRVQPLRAGEHVGGATCVNVMYDAVERLGRSGAGTQERREFLEKLWYLGREGGRAATAAAVSGLQELSKELVLA